MSEKQFESPPPYSEHEEVVVEAPLPKTRVPLYDADKLTRTIFLRNVYAVLAVQGLVICLMISMFVYCPLVHVMFDEMSGWTFWPVWISVTALASMVLSVKSIMNIMRIPPMEFVLTSLVTITTGLLLSALSAFLRTELILVDAGIVTGVCIAVICYTFQHKYYYTPERSTCYVWFCLVVAYGFLTIAYGPKESFWIILAPFIFFTYMVVTTVLMMRDVNLLLLSNEHFFGAVSISMFFVNSVMRLVVMLPCLRRCFSQS